jgi:hypothetical protein
MRIIHREICCMYGRGKLVTVGTIADKRAHETGALDRLRNIRLEVL